MSQAIRTKAIVLRRTNYGEADRILQIITPELGRFAVMAKGVRREKSKLAGGIELFAICDMALARGVNNTGEIWTLTGSRLNKFFAQIMTDYDRLQFGYEVIKLIAKYSDSVDESEFYHLLEQSFQYIDNIRINLMITQTWFYLRLAKLLGNELNVSIDASGMKLIEDAKYDFDQNHESFVYSEDGSYDSSTIKILRILSSNDPEIASRISGINDMIGECLGLARLAAKI